MRNDSFVTNTTNNNPSTALTLLLITFIQSFKYVHQIINLTAHEALAVHERLYSHGVECFIENNIIFMGKSEPDFSDEISLAYKLLENFHSPGTHSRCELKSKHMLESYICFTCGRSICLECASEEHTNMKYSGEYFSTEEHYLNCECGATLYRD